MSVHQFPRAHARTWGQITVGQEEDGDFLVWHESESGGSVGDFQGPFKRALDAIDAAHDLNARRYKNEAHIWISPRAMAEAYPCYPGTKCAPAPRPAPRYDDAWEF